MRRNKELAPGSDSIRTGCWALGGGPAYRFIFVLFFENLLLF